MIGRFHESFLTYRRYRYLAASVLLIALALTLTLVITPAFGPARGDSAVGYVLGIISAVLLLWLGAFGLRKRRYGAGNAPLRAWLSAHVYLGGAIPLLALAHSGFQVGFGVHGVAFWLTLATVLTGVLGAIWYHSMPTHLTQNRAGSSQEELLKQLAGLDGETRELGAALPDPIRTRVLEATAQTQLAPTLLSRFWPRVERCPSHAALEFVQDAARDSAFADTERVARLIALLSRKCALLQRVRREIQLTSLLDLWLFFHIPLAMATIVALALHIAVALYYG